MNASKRKIIVVGAGIVGTSIAYHLARKNAHVTLIDKATRPASEATEKSFGWIVAACDASEGYLNFRQQAIADWHRIEKEFNGQLKIDWSGALIWQESLKDTEQFALKLLNSNSQVRIVNHKEIRRLEPNLINVPSLAIFAENEGAIDPILSSALFVKAASEAGVDVRLGLEVSSLLHSGSRISGVVTANGNLSADMVVLAAGVQLATLCQPLGIMLPVNSSPAILIRLHNDHRFINRIVSSSFLEIRATSKTDLIAAEDYIDQSKESNPLAIAQRTVEKIKYHWNGADHIKIVDVTVGRRPMPNNGMPIIGRTTRFDGLYISLMHPGVTLAAVAGRLAAAEIMGEGDNSLLSLYRPGTLI